VKSKRNWNHLTFTSLKRTTKSDYLFLSSPTVDYVVLQGNVAWWSQGLPIHPLVDTLHIGSETTTVSGLIYMILL